MKLLRYAILAFCAFTIGYAVSDNQEEVVYIDVNEHEIYTDKYHNVVMQGNQRQYPRRNERNSDYKKDKTRV